MTAADLARDTGALAAACLRDLGDPAQWFVPAGYPESLALCIVDSIYSTGGHYTSAANVVARYTAHRTDEGGNPYADSAGELLASIDACGGPDAWASAIGNRRPTSTAKGAPLKAEAIAQAARALLAEGIATTADLRSAPAGTLAGAERAWRAVPGQRSGLTWNYALILAHIPGVKADRMVTRYVARALERTTTQRRAEDAAALVRAVAERQGWDVIRTDHAIWRYESGRPVNRPPQAT